MEETKQQLEMVEGARVYILVAKACIDGNLEVLKWLHTKHTEGFTTGAMEYACLHGHLEVVKWLHINRTEGCTTNAMEYACYGGHLEVVKWLKENK